MQDPEDGGAPSHLPGGPPPQEGLYGDRGGHHEPPESHGPHRELTVLLEFWQALAQQRDFIRLAKGVAMGQVLWRAGW